MLPQEICSQQIHQLSKLSNFNLQDSDAPRLKIQPARFAQQLLDPFVHQTVRKGYMKNIRLAPANIRKAKITEVFSMK